MYRSFVNPLLIVCSKFPRVVRAAGLPILLGEVDGRRCLGTEGGEGGEGRL